MKYAYSFIANITEDMSALLFQILEERRIKDAGSACKSHTRDGGTQMILALPLGPLRSNQEFMAVATFPFHSQQGRFITQ